MKTLVNREGIHQWSGRKLKLMGPGDQLDLKSWLIGKDSDAGRDWGQEDKGTTEDEMAGWHHWLDGRWVWVNSGSWWWTGRPGVLRFMWSQRVGHDWATELNWADWWLWLAKWFRKVQLYEEILKTIKKNIIKILIVDIFPLLFFFFLVIKVMPFIKNEKI